MSGLSELFGKISGSLLPVLFISFAAPLLMMALICRGRSRKLLFFLLFGTTACLLSGYANSIIRSLSGLSSGFFNTNFAPAIEETLKALPIVILAFSKNHDKRTLLECSVAVGIGFAVLENAATLARNIEIISLPLALGRGFGSRFGIGGIRSSGREQQTAGRLFGASGRRFGDGKRRGGNFRRTERRFGGAGAGRKHWRNGLRHGRFRRADRGTGADAGSENLF